MPSELSAGGMTPYCGISSGLGPLGYWGKDLSLDAQVRREMKETAGSNPQSSGCSSNDAILAVGKLELHFTLQDEYGNASLLDHHFQEEVHNVYPYNPIGILRYFKWETSGRVADRAEHA